MVLSKRFSGLSEKISFPHPPPLKLAVLPKLIECRGQTALKNPKVIVRVSGSPGARVNVFVEPPRRSRLFDILKTVGQAIWKWWFN